MHELKRTTQIKKEEMITDLENLRRKNQTEIQEIKSPYSQTKNTMQDHSSSQNKWKKESQSLKIKYKLKKKKQKKS
jgi:hypothetical protein